MEHQVCFNVMGEWRPADGLDALLSTTHKHLSSISEERDAAALPLNWLHEVLDDFLAFLFLKRYGPEATQPTLNCTSPSSSQDAGWLQMSGVKAERVLEWFVDVHVAVNVFQCSGDPSLRTVARRDYFNICAHEIGFESPAGSPKAPLSLTALWFGPFDIALCQVRLAV